MLELPKEGFLTKGLESEIISATQFSWQSRPTFSVGSVGYMLHFTAPKLHDTIFAKQGKSSSAG